MLPDFLFTVNQSMQEIPRDEFSPLSSEKDMCGALAVQRTTTSNSPCRTPASPVLAVRVKTPAPPDDLAPKNGDGLHLDGVKVDGSSSVDLFPTHPTTWHQHPMNSPEHAHLRLRQASPQPHHHHHHYHHNHDHPQRYDSKLLLQGSEDPLICCGATNDDEHPLELKSLIAAAVNGRQAQQPPVPAAPERASRHRVQPAAAQKRQQSGSTCSPLTKQQLKMKAGLLSAQSQGQSQLTGTPVAAAPAAGSAKQPRAPKPKKGNGVLKLRFHHQALPPEYLNHYEATQEQQAARAALHQQQQASAAAAAAAGGSSANEVQPPKKAHTARLPPPKTPHENVRSWLQKIAEIQRSAELQQQRKRHDATAGLSAHPLNGVSLFDDNNNNCKTDNNSPEMRPIQTRSFAALPVAERVPSALEATHTVAGSVPQPHPHPHAMAATTTVTHDPRKRVVKYSDLPYMGEITLDNSKPRRGRKPKKTDICHLIYKNYGTIFPGTPQNVLSASAVGVEGAAQRQPDGGGALDEPLNLCLRDQLPADLCSISSAEDDYAQTSDSCSTATTPVTTPSDLINDSLLAANLNRTLQHPEGVTPLPAGAAVEARSCPQSAHTVSVYYQKLIEASALLQPNARIFGLPVETIEKDNQIALKIQLPSGLLSTPKLEKSSPALPGHGGAGDYPEPLSTPSSIKSENSTGTPTSAANAPPLTPQKRKRSAIFVPPKPAESTASPATEVSICKFKFTGGDNPCLQEKKMLSVDSDGTYRYFNGGGASEKPPLRCELFIRDHHQPPVSGGGGVALEKLSMDVAPPSAGISNELLQLPDSPGCTLLLPPPTAPSPDSPSTYVGGPLANGTPHHYRLSAGAIHGHAHDDATPGCSTGLAFQPLTRSALHLRSSERKKKSRRSTQREKLEKTFMEKGFLIQTQQLESAEGATYCKFRQLKKFTRYLFRNWKDYLPEDVHHAKVVAAAAAAGKEVLMNGDEAAALQSLLASHSLVPDEVMKSGKCKDLTFIEVAAPASREPEGTYNWRSDKV